MAGIGALAGPVFVSYSQPIRFARFDGKSVNRSFPVLDQARAQARRIVGSGDEIVVRDSCCCPNEAGPLETRMTRPEFRDVGSAALSRHDPLK